MLIAQRLWNSLRSFSKDFERTGYREDRFFIRGETIFCESLYKRDGFLRRLLNILQIIAEIARPTHTATTSAMIRRRMCGLRASAITKSFDACRQ